MSTHKFSPFKQLMDAEIHLAKAQQSAYEAKREMLIELMSQGRTDLVEIKMDALYRENGRNRKHVIRSLGEKE